MSTHLANPYSFIVRQNTLPLSLLASENSTKQGRVHLLDTEPFAQTFSDTRRRKRVKLGVGSYEELVEGAGKAH
ncbi:hypothetical protein HDU93_005752, partial [Gonapodya sp. JEL0774]